MSVDLGTEAPGEAWQSLALAMAALPAGQDIPDPSLPACHAEGTAQKQAALLWRKAASVSIATAGDGGCLSPVPVSWSRTLGLLCAHAHHGNVGGQKAKWFELLQDCPGM